MARRVIGPTWSWLHDRSSTPVLGTSPYVGLSPAMPQIDAGIRMLPPVSEPIAPKAQPAATDAPEPLLDPPVTLLVSHGLATVPVYVLTPVGPNANSTRLVFPNTMAPESMSRCATVAVRSAMFSSSTFDPPAVRLPCTSTRSLRAMGMPCNGPRYLPDSISAVAFCAASIASSAHTSA